MIPKVLFADTSFWFGLTDPRDQHHANCVAWSDFYLQIRIRLITTDAVMWELLNMMSAPSLRKKAAAIYRLMQTDPHVRLVTWSSDSNERALSGYMARADKGWSLTDCLSFLLMSDEGLSAALTSDHHFEQAGFAALLTSTPQQTRFS